MGEDWVFLGFPRKVPGIPRKVSYSKSGVAGAALAANADLVALMFWCLGGICLLVVPWELAASASPWHYTGDRAITPACCLLCFRVPAAASAGCLE